MLVGISYKRKTETHGLKLEKLWHYKIFNVVWSLKMYSKLLIVKKDIFIFNDTLATLNQNTKLFIHENAFTNLVWDMAAILSRGRWVNAYLWQIGGKSDGDR